MDFHWLLSEVQGPLFSIAIQRQRHGTGSRVGSSTNWQMRGDPFYSIREVAHQGIDGPRGPQLDLGESCRLSLKESGRAMPQKIFRG